MIHVEAHGVDAHALPEAHDHGVKAELELPRLQADDAFAAPDAAA